MLSKIKHFLGVNCLDRGNQNKNILFVILSYTANWSCELVTKQETHNISSSWSSILFSGANNKTNIASNKSKTIPLDECLRILLSKV